MINYGLFGFNTKTTSTLFAVHGNDLVNVDTGIGYNLNLNNTIGDDDCKYSMVSFLGRSFFFKRNDLVSLSFNGTNWLDDWTNNLSCPHRSGLSKVYKNRIYLADTNFPYFAATVDQTWRSRVFYSNLPDHNNLTWGIGIIPTYEDSKIIDNNIITSGQGKRAYFKSNGIKPGDPLFISWPTTSKNYGKWTVKEVIDEYNIRIVEDFNDTTESGISFWVGSNWFDVNTDDGDYITALEENNNRLMIFKNDSLYRYDTSSLVKVKNVPGTTSRDSVINVRDYTIYFHGSNKEKTGFYLYDGVSSQRISNAIQPFIDGISTDNYDSVVAWREGDVYRAYVGNLSNTNSSNPAYNISKTNAVFSYNIPTNEWKIDTCNHVIKAATTMREDNQEKIFVQDNSGKVFQMNYGNSYSGADIPFKLELQPYYPRGVEVMNRFTRIKIVSRDARGVSVSYKLWNKPFAVDGEYHGLGDIEDDVTELLIPTEHYKACGLQLMFQEIGQTEPTFTIEKVSIYSEKDIIDTPERKEQR